MEYLWSEYVQPISAGCTPISTLDSCLLYDDVCKTYNYCVYIFHTGNISLLQYADISEKFEIDKIWIYSAPHNKDAAMCFT
jgi:hypothetical protein